jgi:hypothetical protein
MRAGVAVMIGGQPFRLLVLQKGHSHGDSTMRGCRIRSALVGERLRPPLWRKKGGNTWLLRSRLDSAIDSVSFRDLKDARAPAQAHKRCLESTEEHEYNYG